MLIENKTVTVNVLRPENPDNWLTNGEAFSKEIYIGPTVNLSDWREITDDEFEKITERLIREAEGF